jgi:hypothetical protein
MGVLGYLIKTRLIPFLINAIEQKKAEEHNLKISAKRAQEGQTEVADHIEGQKLYAQELLDRIKQWNDVVDENDVEQKVLEKKGKKEIAAFIEKQQQSLLMDHLKKEMAPCIMAEASQALEEIFAVKAQQDKFIANTVDSLEKEQG